MRIRVDNAVLVSECMRVVYPQCISILRLVSVSGGLLEHHFEFVKQSERLCVIVNVNRSIVLREQYAAHNIELCVAIDDAERVYFAVAFW